MPDETSQDGMTTQHPNPMKRPGGAVVERRRLGRDGLEAGRSSTACLNELAKRDLRRWADLVKRSGAKTH